MVGWILKSAGQVVILSNTSFNAAFDTPVPLTFSGTGLIVLSGC